MISQTAADILQEQRSLLEAWRAEGNAPISGRVYYSSKSLFQSQQKIVMVGLNPGPGPLDRELQDKEDNQQEAWDSNNCYCSWLDDHYGGYQPGKHPNQCTMQLFFTGLNNIDKDICIESAIRKTPYINLIPVRSSSFDDLNQTTINAFLPSSLKILSHLKPEIIICFGARTQKILNIGVGKQNNNMYPLSVFVNVGHFSTRGLLLRNIEWINNNFWPIAINYYT